MSAPSSVTAFAPGTVANVGPGFDVLGFAIEGRGDEVTATRTDSRGVTIVSIEGDQGKLPLDASRNTAGVAARQVLEFAGVDFGVELSLVKRMPLASGMGSSAASAVAAAVATNALLPSVLSPRDLLQFAMEGERVACGTAHADNAAPSLLGGFVLVRGGGPHVRVDPISVPEGLFCAVLHPHLAIPTGEARDVLPTEVPLSGAVQQWGNVAALIAGLEQADFALIQSAASDVLIEPIRKARIPSFDDVVGAAREAGALGASLSGSGPSIFALCPGRTRAEDVADAMTETFEGLTSHSSDAFVSPVGAPGARVLSEAACDS